MQGIKQQADLTPPTSLMQYSPQSCFTCRYRSAPAQHARTGTHTHSHSHSRTHARARRLNPNACSARVSFRLPVFRSVSVCLSRLARGGGGGSGRAVCVCGGGATVSACHSGAGGGCGPVPSVFGRRVPPQTASSTSTTCGRANVRREKEPQWKHGRKAVAGGGTAR